MASVIFVMYWVVLLLLQFSEKLGIEFDEI